MDKTWVRFYRRQIENGWLKNHKLWVFWTYCLLRASYKERTIKIGFQDVEIKPGQFIFGRVQASKDLNMSERSIRTCLSALKNSQNIAIKTTNKFSIITVINWDTYQFDNNETTSKTTSNRPATDHKQEGKESKEKRKAPIPKDFSLKEEHKNYALQNGLFESEITTIFENFIIYHKKKGTKFVDWFAAWQTWVRNEKKFNSEKYQINQNTQQAYTWEDHNA